MTQLKNGDYLIDVTLQGGSGRAYIVSPAKVHIENDDIEAQIEWSSKSYDYMEVDGVGYKPVNAEGNSTFIVKLKSLDAEIPVKAETTAMSTPHMIDYTIKFNTASERTANSPSFAVTAVTIGIALICAVVLGAVVIGKIRRGEDEN